MEIKIDELRLKKILLDLYKNIYKLEFPASEAHNTVEIIKYALNPDYEMDVKLTHVK